MFIAIVILIIICSITTVILQSKSDNKKKVFLQEKYKEYEIISCKNYFILLGKDKIIAVLKNFAKNETKHQYINIINEIKIYENGKEASAGKAIAGGITFGLVGAIIGSSMKTQYINKLGIKLYTDNGCINLSFLSSKTKRDSLLYNAVTQQIDSFYSKLLPYVK